jgi:hypothetical protein
MREVLFARGLLGDFTINRLGELGPAAQLIDPDSRGFPMHAPDSLSADLQLTAMNQGCVKFGIASGFFPPHLARFFLVQAGLGGSVAEESPHARAKIAPARSK